MSKQRVNVELPEGKSYKKGCYHTAQIQKQAFMWYMYTMYRNMDIVWVHSTQPSNYAVYLLQQKCFVHSCLH